jgi:predicted MFS family arabinose efflux permease
MQRRLDRLTQQLGGPARRRVIVLLALVLALSAADGSAVGAVAAQLEHGLHINAAELGLLVTTSSLVGALFALPCGVLVDKTQRVRLLALSIVTWGIAEAVAGFAPTFGFLLLTRLALGAVTATAVPAVASLTGDFFPAGERGRIYGYIVTGEIVGAGVGIGVASLVAGAVGWRTAFVVLALPSFALAWALWQNLPEPARGGQSRLEPGATEIVAAGRVGKTGAAAEAAAPARTDDLVLTRVEERGVAPDENIVMAVDPDRMTMREVVAYVLRVRTNLTIIVASSLGFFFVSGLRTFAVLFARGHFGVGQGVATVLLGLIGIGSVIGLLTAGRTADWLIRRGHLDARIVVAGVMYLAAALVLLPALLSRGIVVSLALLFVAAAAISAPNPPLDAAQLDVMPAQVWGRAQGVRTALRSTLEALGPLLFGVVAQLFVRGSGSLPTSANGAIDAAQTHGLEVAFLLMLVPLAAAGVLLLVTRRQYVIDVASAGESERRGRRHAESGAGGAAALDDERATIPE